MSNNGITRRAFLGAVAGIIGTFALPVRGDNWPLRPLRIIVPFPPGQGADIIARLVGERLAQALGHPVTIDNKPGAGGTLGADLTAKAAPDGYTLGMAGPATMSIGPSLYPKLSYSPTADFAPVARMGTVPFVFLVNAASPLQNVRDLIVQARARPGELTYGSSGSGSTSHLVQALFTELAGIRVTHVPYKGSAPNITDLLGGRTTFTAETTAAALPYLQSGKLRGIGVSSIKRIPFLPDIPTLDEQGVKGYDAIAWAGLVAPAGTPAHILDRLNAEIVRIVGTPELQQRFATMATIPTYDTREQFSAFLKTDSEQWARAVKVSGATAQ